MTTTTTTTTTIPPSALFSSIYLKARRPWLALYNLRLTRRRERENGGGNDDDAPTFLDLLQPELLNEIIACCPPYAVGRFACTCVYASELCRQVRVSERMCFDAYTESTVAQLESNDDNMAWLLAPLRSRRRRDDPSIALAHKVLRRECWELFRGSWRLMWLFKPRLRFDGVYVSRNSYVRFGGAQWRASKQVNLVVYYRMYRFYPDGTCVYRTTPAPPRLAVKDLHCNHHMVELTRNEQGAVEDRGARRRAARGGRGGGGAAAADCTHGAASTKTGKVMLGRYRLDNSGEIMVSIMYPGTRPTEVRTELVVRSTCAGAYNRLDVLSLTTEYEDPALAVEQRRARAAAAAAQQAAAVAAAARNPHTAAERFGGGAAPTVALMAANEETPATLDGVDAAPAAALPEVDGHRSVDIDPNSVKSYVFIPEEEVETHLLNKDASELDFFVTG